jgi:hypothetical protein
MKTLLSLSDFITWLNSMTTTELIHEFPNTFHLPLAGDSKQSTVTKLLANDAILWRLVKEYNKFLKKPLTISMFEGKSKLFFGGQYINRQPSIMWNTYEINNFIVFQDTNVIKNQSIGRIIEDLCPYNVKLTRLPIK